MSRWHAPYVLGLDLMQSGHTAEGVALLERAISDPESRQVPSAAGELYSYYTRTGQHAEAVQVVKTSLDRSPDSMAPQMYLNLGRAHLALGEYQAAEQAFNRVLPAFEEEQRRLAEHRIGEDGIPSRDLRGEMWRLEAMVAEGLDQAQSGRQGRSAYDTAVYGSVLQGGRPLPGMHIMLVANDQGYGMVIPPPDGLHHEILTGPDGSFEFTGVAPGAYQVGLRLPGADARALTGYHLLISGSEFTLEAGTPAEVEFRFVSPVSLVEMQGDPENGLTVQWEPYPGAKAYSVVLGASFNRPNGSSGMSTAAQYDFPDTRITLQGFDFYHLGHSSDDKGFLPYSIAGLPVAADEVWLDIQALDREARVIGSLRGLRFSAGSDVPGYIDSSGIKRSQADVLLRERKYDQAVAAYAADLKQDPGNRHALTCLLQIYRYGTAPWGEAPDGHHVERDLAKALDYGRRLADLTMDERVVSIVRDLEVEYEGAR